MLKLNRFVLAALLVPAAFTIASARGTDDNSDVTSERKDVTRIVQAGSAAFMVQNALYLFPEAYERVVAVADGDQGSGHFLADLDESYADDKSILPKNVNTESILALRPETVVMKNFLKGRMGAPLENMGVPTLYLDLETPEAWMRDLDSVGELFGNPERAEEIKSMFNQRISSVTGALKGLPESSRPETLILYWSVKDGASAVNVPPMGWIQTHMVEMAGGRPVWRDADLTERWTRVNLEQIAAWDPDEIIVAAYHIPAEKALQEISVDPTWSSIRAVRENRIHAFPADYHSWDQPDIRWLLGLSWLASVLHPDRFPDADITAEARGFYRDFYRMDDAAFERMIGPRLSGLD